MGKTVRPKSAHTPKSAPPSSAWEPRLAEAFSIIFAQKGNYSYLIENIYG